ncbi:MAG: hypothetical protein HYV94_02505 [Candidatus Rokubacteria bacterium]|nr:hypothetical protein [Candidatus Rokubacteria bacterium]
MTNTLHRWSEHYAPGRRAEAPPVTDDFIVFAMAARGLNDEGDAEKYRTFARLAFAHNPVNVGDGSRGGMYRPSPALTPGAHWRRDDRPDPEALLRGIEGHTVLAAVFRTREDMEGFVRDLKAADLGISINISAPMDAAAACCRAAGLTRHSVEYSLGFQGRLDRLPERTVLEISTMCGHGMVSGNLVKKLIDWVKEGRRTPAQATRYLARFCTCGVFNPPRAEALFEKARTSGA